MFKNLLNKLAGSPYERELATYREVVGEVNHFEEEYRAALGLVEGEPPEATEEMRAFLQDRMQELRDYVAEQVKGIEDAEERYRAEQAALDEVLPQSFALTRIAAWLTIGLRHYDVQLIGGLVLHRGKIAEMKTGEGKTLVASLPLVLNALAGRGVHLVTVNDYLARRDGGWMGPIYDLLGLTTAVIGKEQYSALFDLDYVDPGGDLEDERLVHWRPVPRRECYRADITYGTASEFGFDYLRDNTATTLDRTVQGVHAFAIVDEVDSVLIDTARTPLIISGPAGEAASTYVRFAEIIEKVRLRRNTTDLSKDEEPNGDYVLDDRTQTVSLTDSGIEKVERLLPEINTAAGESIYDPQYYEMVHYLENALKAKYLFHRDKEYIVSNGSIVLIDQTTGRAMPSRRYSDGLHQAIEAKEGVAVQRENVTIATITVQNYFRMYDKLSGMTGTAVTQAEEFDEVYNLDVVAIPTNVEYRAAEKEIEERKERHPEENVQIISYWDPENPGDQPLYYKRTDYPDQVYMTVNAKFNAVANEIAELVRGGRPILVGTGSVESSEVLANKLKKMGLPHEVLNAKNNQREALIVAQAGRPGSVTISTNMAGRGTDILLGGNPEGLASKLITDRCFTINALQKVVTSVIEGDLDAAKKAARTERYMDEDIVEWVQKENNSLVKKASVEDILSAVAADIRDKPEYADIPFDTIFDVIQQIELTAIDSSRSGRAQAIVEKNDLPASLIPDMEFLLNQYRSLSGLLGQTGHITTLTQMLMEKHYNARAALVRAVLNGDLEDARAVTTKVPALPQSLIREVQDLQASCKAASREVWQSGGLHVIGTERHESRRIDDQLRGRAARQGDPGSSRFYLSLEDDLMIRFGGERTKSMMERLNMPEDLPIAANILSGAIEQAQSRFETYYFEIRKNLIEYDEAVNRQRELVYTERRAVLEGDGGELDEIVQRFLGESIEAAIDRYRDNYEQWAMSEVESVITDFSSMETGEVNARGVVGRVKGLFPRVSEDELNTLYNTLDSDDLTDYLHGMILDGMDEGYHLRMLAAEINRIVPLWPTLPAPTDRGIPGWDVYVERLRDVVSGYLADMPAEQADELETALYSELDAAYREYVTGVGRGGGLREVHSTFMNRVTMALEAVYQPVLEYLQPDELRNTLLERIDSLLEVAHSGDEIDTPDHQIYGIGAQEIVNYERALMLSVLDQEWRQYLQAIDDLRQGISLEAYGQRDPKIEFKRRAFDMFEALRQGVRDGVSRRFFWELPRHRQIVEAQARRAAQLDQLAAQGYRIQRRSNASQQGGQPQAVSQTVQKDIWSSVGRNDPCPCGSGKKFKDCHYPQIRQQQAAASQPAPSGGGRSKRRRRR